MGKQVEIVAVLGILGIAGTAIVAEGISAASKARSVVSQVDSSEPNPSTSDCKQVGQNFKCDTATVVDPLLDGNRTGVIDVQTNDIPQSPATSKVKVKNGTADLNDPNLCRLVFQGDYRRGKNGYRRVMETCYLPPQSPVTRSTPTPMRPASGSRR